MNRGNPIYYLIKGFISRDLLLKEMQLPLDIINDIKALYIKVNEKNIKKASWITRRQINRIVPAVGIDTRGWIDSFDLNLFGITAWSSGDEHYMDRKREEVLNAIYKHNISYDNINKSLIEALVHLIYS